MGIHQDDMKNEIHTNGSQNPININDLPLNEEFNITLVQYQISTGNVRIKLFKNGVEMFSEIRERKGPFNDVSCFVPASSKWPPTRNLKFTLQPPIFVKEHYSTPKMTHLATLSTWPQPSTPFKIKLKIKILATLAVGAKKIIDFYDRNYPSRRLPTIYLKSTNQVMAFHRSQDGVDYKHIGAWNDITPGVYHQLKLAQEQQPDGSFKIIFYINGVSKGSRDVLIPDTVYSNIDVMVAGSAFDADYVIKDVDYGGFPSIS
ncbi:uncharacterized protein [Clytia hemisphaerica]